MVGAPGSGGGGGGDGGDTDTIADFASPPPMPVQVSVNVLVVASAPVGSVPLVARPPDQAPEAVQPVASVDDQLSVELALVKMDCGLAAMATIGGGTTMTVADFTSLPPIPVQVSVKVPVVASAPVGSVPLVALAPDQAPEAVQPVASVDDQVRVELAPLASACGLALIVTAGGDTTVTVADFTSLPPAPVHLRVKVLVLTRAPVDSVPLVPLAPDQAPEAAQPLASVDDQVRKEPVPLAIACGLAPRMSAGGGDGGEVLPPEEPPPQAAIAAAMAAHAAVNMTRVPTLSPLLRALLGPLYIQRRIPWIYSPKTPARCRSSMTYARFTIGSAARRREVPVRPLRR